MIWLHGECDWRFYCKALNLHPDNAARALHLRTLQSFSDGRNGDFQPKLTTVGNFVRRKNKCAANAEVTRCAASFNVVAITSPKESYREGNTISLDASMLHRVSSLSCSDGGEVSLRVWQAQDQQSQWHLGAHYLTDSGLGGGWG